MRKEKNPTHTTVNPTPFMKVVEAGTDQSKLEFEIELHVKSIRALIKRLQPLERQRYYEGLLLHILSQPVEYPKLKNVNNTSFDYCNLTVNELSLIKELSGKIHELYRMTEDEASN